MAFSFGKIFSFLKRPTYVPSSRRVLGGSISVHVDEDIAMTVAAYHRGVSYISTQIAKLPWEVKDRENEIQDGLLSTLISLRPNPEMNSIAWRLFTIQNAIHYGNSFSEIQRDTIGRPIALWPIPSRDVDFVRTPDGELLYRVQGEYAPGGVAYLRPQDVFHIKNAHTKDGIVGQGLVAYAHDTLGIAKAADRMASGIFVNSGMPSGTLTVAGVLSDEAYKRIMDSWVESGQGKKAGGVRVLEQGAKFEALNLEPEALQFLESRKFGVLEIARFLGLPPTKLFDAGTATFSNVENANLEVATDTLDFWACNLEMEADVKLLNNRFGGRYTELDLYSVFRGDMTTRANYFSKMMQMGAMTPNQVRAREGMAKSKEGDRYYIAVNNYTPADRIDEVIDAQIANKSKEPAEKDVTPKEKEDDDDVQKQLAAAALKFLQE